MQMFMDVHPGLGDATPEEINEAHQRDLEMQDEYGVKWLSYWFNDPAGKAFCLVEAPDADAVKACHKAAHGLMPHDIIEVTAPTLATFMGEWHKDQADRAMTPDNQPDTGLRVIMFTDIEGSTAMSTSLGDAAAVAVVQQHDEIVRNCLDRCGGREVKHTGDGILASFSSASGALDAARQVHNGAGLIEGLRVKIGMSAGEPVDGTTDIYGAAVNLAARICSEAGGGETLVAATIRDLSIGKQAGFDDRGSITLKGFPEPVRLYAAV